MEEPDDLSVKVIETFTRVAETIADRKLTDLHPDTRIDELGVGSAVLVEIIGELEVELDVEFPNDQLGALHTIGDLTRLARSLRDGRG
jgi:acyl carrier protein